MISLVPLQRVQNLLTSNLCRALLLAPPMPLDTDYKTCSLTIQQKSTPKFTSAVPHIIIYFCRINHNDFNYSSNPTYVSGGIIRVKNENRSNPPLAYITTIGLYNSSNELLAVAKLSEPLRKDPTNELTLRVRLDY